ncbi:hypothetical protein REPUB_Repub11eG0026200 [Reevesia pubescens]
MSKLVDTSKLFDRVGHRATLPGIEFFSSKDLITSKSSTAIFSKTMEPLKDDEVNMIGVWGIGGVGKTTLVKEVDRVYNRRLSQSIEMRCNACWGAISTTCVHLLYKETVNALQRFLDIVKIGTEDASKIISNDAACPICDQVLSKRSGGSWSL